MYFLLVKDTLLVLLAFVPTSIFCPERETIRKILRLKSPLALSRALSYPRFFVKGILVLDYWVSGGFQIISICMVCCVGERFEFQNMCASRVLLLRIVQNKMCLTSWVIPATLADSGLCENVTCSNKSLHYSITMYLTPTDLFFVVASLVE